MVLRKFKIIKLLEVNLLFTKNFKPLLISYILVLFLLNVLPINGKESALNNNYFLHIRWNYLGHSLLLIPLFPLIYLSFKKSSLFKISILLPITISLLVAISTEFIQYFISWRTFNVNDLFANIIGVFFGVVGIFAVVNLKRKLRVI